MACNCNGNQKKPSIDNSNNNVDGDNAKEYLCKCCDDKIKAKFGLAWVASFPNCPYNEPLGWQVEFSGTAADVESKCQQIIDWVNAPPLQDNTISELKSETAESTSPCSCYPQQDMNNNNYYNEQFQNNYYPDYYRNESGGCTCQNRDIYCTRCKTCKVLPEVPYKVDPTPPDIIKLCPPKIKETTCKCTPGINNLTSVKSVSCDPKCSQGILRKCKSHPVSKSSIRSEYLPKEAQDNCCQCNTIHSADYISKSPTNASKISNYYDGNAQVVDKYESVTSTDPVMASFTSANDVEIVSLTDN